MEKKNKMDYHKDPNGPFLKKHLDSWTCWCVLDHCPVDEPNHSWAYSHRLKVGHSPSEFIDPLWQFNQLVWIKLSTPTRHRVEKVTSDLLNPSLFTNRENIERWQTFPRMASQPETLSPEAWLVLPQIPQIHLHFQILHSSYPFLWNHFRSGTSRYRAQVIWLAAD